MCEFHDMKTGRPCKYQWRIKTNHLKATRENVALQCSLPFVELIRFEEQGKLQCASACNSPESLYPEMVTTQKSGCTEDEYILLCKSPCFPVWLGLFSIFHYLLSDGNQQASSTIGNRSSAETISRLEQGFHLPQQWRWIAGVQGGHREVSIHIEYLAPSDLYTALLRPCLILI